MNTIVQLTSFTDSTECVISDILHFYELKIELSQITIPQTS